MTREEAIKLIDTHTVCFYNEIDSPTLQALHMAIEALSANLKEEFESADAISREFYEDAVKANIGLVIENRKLKEQIESADAVQGDECDHCVYKWGMKGGDYE